VKTGRDSDLPETVSKLASKYRFTGYKKFLDPEGYPAIKPPWGTLTAIDLAAGELAWQVPLGEVPELAAQGFRGTGAENYGGPVVTAGGLVFIAAALDAKLRAFDKRTGELLFEHALPAAGFATPAVYEAAGRQFVVVAAGGGKLGRPSGDRYVAFALPEEEQP
jgi:quinoprotein glucose dehydrogenase